MNKLMALRARLCGLLPDERVSFPLTLGVRGRPERAVKTERGSFYFAVGKNYFPVIFTWRLTLGCIGLIIIGTRGRTGRNP